MKINHSSFSTIITIIILYVLALEIVPFGHDHINTSLEKRNVNSILYQLMAVLPKGKTLSCFIVDSFMDHWLWKIKFHGHITGFAIYIEWAMGEKLARSQFSARIQTAITWPTDFFSSGKFRSSEKCQKSIYREKWFVANGFLVIWCRIF